MSTAIRHSVPRSRDVALEQVRVVGASLRREALVVAVVLGVVTVMLGVEIATGGPGFDSREAFPTPLVSFLVPFAVWRRRPFDSALLWTLPVDRRMLALAKVLAGGVWTVALLAAFTTWLMLFGAVAGVPALESVQRVPYIASIAAYLFGSALVLGLRHPLRWLLGSVGLVALLGLLTDVRGVQARSGTRGLAAALGAAWPNWPSTTTALLATGLGVVALWAAITRHGDRRRA